jgi:hypothetical protein
MLSHCASCRLSFQLDVVATILADTPETAIAAPGAGGSWSAREHLAHLARVHEILLERLRRILREDAPHFAAYDARQDPDWPHWAALPTRDVLTRMQALRGELLGLVRDLSEAQLSRQGTHPELGRLPVSAWLETFFLHEGHHLHVAWSRLAEARRESGRETPAGA